MLLIGGIIVFIALVFGLVVFIGPPYLPTLKRQKMIALDMLNLKPGQTLLEVGSGDGRVVLEAAKRGLNVVGIEINPFLIIISWMVTRKYRKQVRFVWASYWGRPWPQADGIYTFMLPRYMHRLDKRIEQWHSKPMQLVSFAFPIPDKPIAKQQDGVFLYTYK